MDTRFYNNVERPNYTPNIISALKPDEVFVFGSNLQGFHSGGAAKVALNKFGAIFGQGIGLQGQSYAIPTMQGGVATIKPYVDQFINFANQHKNLFFFVTRIGCGTAGFNDVDIAPLFADAVEMDNVALPKSFCNCIEESKYEFPEISRSVQQKLYQQGQVRTLADIAKELNNRNKYSDVEQFMNDFNNIISDYVKRGTVSAEICQVIRTLISNNEKTLFSKNTYLDVDAFAEMLNDLSSNQSNNPFDAIYSRREKTKMLRLAVLLNEIVHYNSADELCSDLKNFTTKMLNDSFAYPLFFFTNGIKSVWNDIQKDGYMNNELLEKKIFTEHERNVKTYGLEEVIKKDYVSDAPCHPEVYFPKAIGTAPVYVLDENYVDHCTGKPMFVKSCGEGKGPNKNNTFYEWELVESIVERECANGKYEYIDGYYIPKDDSKPVFKVGYGILQFQIYPDKYRKINRIRQQHHRHHC
jgi:hypothetical protein